jgi:hypothetical protein
MSACVLITRAKLAMLNNALDRKVRGGLLAKLTFQQQCRSDRVGRRGEGGSGELLGWFTLDTLAQLRYLWQLVETVESLEGRTLLEAIFSDVLFDCAAPGETVTSTGLRRRHHWGWIADNVRPRILAAHNAIELFHQRVAALDEVFSYNETSSPGLVLQQDARSLALEAEAIDLVVTSPPYVSVIDYTHANRLLYTWMGWHMRAEREHEIGARFRRKRKNALSVYRADMRLARNEIFRVLRPGGACAIVIGESKRFPGTAEHVVADFAQCMPVGWGPVPRMPTRRRVSDRAAREPIEFVCVFRKP